MVGLLHVEVTIDPCDEDDVVGLPHLIDIPTLERRGKCDVCEVFSLPRMAEAAGRQRLRKGWSLDIRHRDQRTKKYWDLTDRADREIALELVKRDKPYFVMLCSPCAKFSLLQCLTDRAMNPEEWDKAVAIEFAVKSTF